jgi:hypothetical protein
MLTTYIKIKLKLNYILKLKKNNYTLIIHNTKKALKKIYQSEQCDSNTRPSIPKTDTLPLSHAPFLQIKNNKLLKLGLNQRPLG